MIRVDTDLLEKLHREISVCTSKGDEAWHRLKMTESEMADNAEFMAMTEAEAVFRQMDSVIQSCRKMEELLLGLESILAELPEGYMRLEKQHIKQITQIGEVMAGIMENFYAAGQDDVERIVPCPEMKEASEIEKFFGGDGK